jgi:hypothetical protein
MFQKPLYQMANLCCLHLLAFGRAVVSIKVLDFSRFARKIEHKRRTNTLLPQAN